MKVTAIGLDLAKSVFQVHGVDDKMALLMASSQDKAAGVVLLGTQRLARK